MTADLPWQEKLAQQLPLLGHRNWIVVADAAYPWQTAPGIETVCTGTAQLDVVKLVLENIDRASHVRPIIYIDRELPFLSEKDAPGVTNYREELGTILGARPVQSIPHDAIIAKLDAAGRAFHTLLLKTTLTLPYTSIFLELDCGYWSAEAEQRLRLALPS